MPDDRRDIGVSSLDLPKARKHLNSTAFVLILAAGLVYLFFAGPPLHSFLHLTVLEILVLLTVSFLGYLVLGLGFRSILRVFSVDLAFREWFGLTVCHSMFNYYLPVRGGLVVKAYYLKKKYGLSYAHYAALTAGSVFLMLATAASAGLVVIFAVAAASGRLFVSLAVALFVVLLGMLIFGLITRQLLGLRFHEKFARLSQFLLNLREGLGLFSEHKKHAFDFCLLSLLLLLVMTARLYLCFLALGFNVQFWTALLIMVITHFSFLITIIPGNLGIKEGIIIFSAGLFGIPADQALAAAVLDRALSMIVIFGFGFVFSKILLDRMGAISWGYKKNS